MVVVGSIVQTGTVALRGIRKDQEKGKPRFILTTEQTSLIDYAG